VLDIPDIALRFAQFREHRQLAFYEAAAISPAAAPQLLKNQPLSLVDAKDFDTSRFRAAMTKLPEELKGVDRFLDVSVLGPAFRIEPRSILLVGIGLSRLADYVDQPYGCQATTRIIDWMRQLDLGGANALVLAVVTASEARLVRPDPSDPLYERVIYGRTRRALRTIQDPPAESLDRPLKLVLRFTRSGTLSTTSYFVAIDEPVAGVAGAIGPGSEGDYRFNIDTAQIRLVQPPEMNRAGLPDLLNTFRAVALWPQRPGQEANVAAAMESAASESEEHSAAASGADGQWVEALDA